MRISDWSSDVCSSDLNEVRPIFKAGKHGLHGDMTANPVGFFQHRDPMTAFCRDQCRLHASRTGTNDKYMLLIPGRRPRPFMFETDRTTDRRVGKECGRT